MVALDPAGGIARELLRGVAAQGMGGMPQQMQQMQMQMQQRQQQQQQQQAQTQQTQQQQMRDRWGARSDPRSGDGSSSMGSAQAVGGEDVKREAGNGLRSGAEQSPSKRAPAASDAASRSAAPSASPREPENQQRAREPAARPPAPPPAAAARVARAPLRSVPVSTPVPATNGKDYDPRFDASRQRPWGGRTVVETRKLRKLWLGDRGVVHKAFVGPATTLSSVEQFAEWREILGVIETTVEEKVEEKKVEEKEAVVEATKEVADATVASVKVDAMETDTVTAKPAEVEQTAT